MQLTNTFVASIFLRKYAQVRVCSVAIVEQVAALDSDGRPCLTTRRRENYFLLNVPSSPVPIIVSGHRQKSMLQLRF
jgi:hypothetical protein